MRTCTAGMTLCNDRVNYLEDFEVDRLVARVGHAIRLAAFPPR